MKFIEDYVCTLNQAKALKKLGVEQESFFVYCPIELPNCNNNIVYNLEFMPAYPNYLSYSAFTSQELGELLKDLDIREYCFCSKLDNEVQARAEFLIYLLENKKA